MRTVGNIIWVVFAGLWLAMGYVIAGIVNFLFIVTIPFGIQCFKLAGYALWPFGRVVVKAPGKGAVSVLANVIWFCVSGVWLALGHLFAGIVLCLTVVGIPMGVACFKMAGLALAPFGKTIVPASMVPPGAVVESQVQQIG